MNSLKKKIMENQSDCFLDNKEKQLEGTCKRPLSSQVILGLLTNFSSVAPSMSLGFSAIAIPALKNTLAVDQISWFASVASLATPFGCFFSGPIADRFGRRTAIFCINITCVIGWLIIALAYHLENFQYPVLIVGRLLTGFSTGLASTPATIYMAEISTPKLRSVFTTWSSISFALGVLLVYTLGFFLQPDWGTIALITAVLPMLGMSFTIFLVPESPAWLIGKNRYQEARTNMCKIFGAKTYNASVDMEIQSLIESKAPKETNKKSKTLSQQVLKKIKHLLKPSCLKPFTIVVTYFIFQQFSGVFVIVFYAIDIVQAAGIQLDSYITIVIIGTVRLFTAILVSYICKKYGRRPLSLLSGTGMTICMVALGSYILMIRQGHVSETLKDTLSFLPLCLLLMYFLTSTVGFLPLPFALSAEVFPTKIRGTASGLAGSFNYLFNFMTVKLYPGMIKTLGREGVFFFYGGVSLIGTVFILFLLPETKDKSLQEIQDLFDDGMHDKKKNESEKEMISLTA